MRSFSVVVLSAFVVALVVGCASNVKFNVRDRATGQPITNYSVTVDNQKYSSGDTAQLNRAVWMKYSAKVEAEGYAPQEYPVKKEIVPELLIGGIIFWPAWAWCYGPSETQDIFLDAPQQQAANAPQQAPLIGQYPATVPGPVR